MKYLQTYKKLNLNNEKEIFEYLIKNINRFYIYMGLFC